MFRWLERIVLACCEPLSPYLPSSRGEDYPLIWYKDLEKHSCGKFSCAMVQGNPVCEDYGHVEPGRQGTFVGIYDGHGGPQASRFACDHLSRHLISEINFLYFLVNITMVPFPCFLCIVNFTLVVLLLKFLVL